MPAGEQELIGRFADYGDDELLRIVTVERANYRREALAAAERILMERGVPPPTFYTEPSPLTVGVALPAAQGQAQRKSQYLFVDFLVDALLILLAAWGWKKLWGWTGGPMGGLLSNAAYWVLTFGFLCSVYSLRRRWRAKQWRD